MSSNKALNCTTPIYIKNGGSSPLHAYQEARKARESFQAEIEKNRF